jgi:hypothetical protein
MVWVAAWLEYGGQGSNVHARGRAWHPVEIDLALFNCILLQIFQQKWAQRE